MKLRINHIALVSVDREFSFNSGLNIIAGPIATGKSTLLRCLRGLLGSNLSNFPREARDNITNLAGRLTIGDNTFDIVRPFVTTPTARVDIAGKDETLRLPVSRTTDEVKTTYGRWLLGNLGLPLLEVPLAPSQEDSELSPVSINDYLMYCHLQQDEIDNSVFNHKNSFQNNKRKYVFEIMFGKYNIELARLQDELRETYREIRRIQSQAKTIDEFLSGTTFENQAKLHGELEEITNSLIELEKESGSLSVSIQDSSESGKLRVQTQEIDARIAELEKRLRLEKESQEQFQRLVGQLRTQSNRLTRSIVAGNYLLDIDFIICPRCGSSLDSGREAEDTCYLCLQHPQPSLDRNDLVREQDRLEKQIAETQELIQLHNRSVQETDKEILNLKTFRESISAELNYLTQTYVSDAASRIASIAHQRAELQERRHRVNDYLQLFNRRDNSNRHLAHLETKAQDIEMVIEAEREKGNNAEERIRFLEEQFREILDRFDVPRYTNQGITGIDRGTYLPILEGRRFDELQSQGLQVMVNVAHVLAHQVTAIEMGLTLPNMILIDGLSGNIGYEGLDLKRVQSMYRYLVNFSQIYGDQTQIIVVDNTVPDFAQGYIRVQFSEEDKLIPRRFLKD